MSKTKQPSRKFEESRQNIEIYIRGRPVEITNELDKMFALALKDCLNNDRSRVDICAGDMTDYLFTLLPSQKQPEMASALQMCLQNPQNTKICFDKGLKNAQKYLRADLHQKIPEQ